MVKVIKHNKKREYIVKYESREYLGKIILNLNGGTFLRNTFHPCVYPGHVEIECQNLFDNYYLRSPEPDINFFRDGYEKLKSFLSAPTRMFSVFSKARFVSAEENDKGHIEIKFKRGFLLRSNITYVLNFDLMSLEIYKNGWLTGNIFLTLEIDKD